MSTLIVFKNKLEGDNICLNYKYGYKKHAGNLLKVLKSFSLVSKTWFRNMIIFYLYGNMIWMVIDP